MNPIPKQNWLVLSRDEIVGLAKQYLHSFREYKANGKEHEIHLDTISLKELYEEGKLSFLFLGKVGGYSGGQDFTDILIEKLADVAHYQKCLWFSSGPNIAKYHRNRDTFRKTFGDKRKIYVLFAPVTTKYQASEHEYYSYLDNSRDLRLFDSGPRDSSERKALIIRKFFLVAEQFDKNKFYQLYYDAISLDDHHYTLPSPLEKCFHNTLLEAWSNDAVLNNCSVQERLGFLTEDAHQESRRQRLEEWKQTRCETVFPQFHVNTEGRAQYILAEVEDYIELDKCDANDNGIDLIAYKKSHPYYR